MPDDISLLWENLPYPEELQSLSVDLKRINYFVVPNKWLTKRIKGIVSEIDVILSVDKIGDVKSNKIKSRRYLPTLKQIPIEQRKELNDWLVRYKTLFSHKTHMGSPAGL